MATSGGRMTGLAYVPPMEPILLRENVPPDRSCRINANEIYVQITTLFIKIPELKVFLLVLDDVVY